MSKTITYAKGDGIGPEIMDATIKILNAAGAPLEYEEIKVGKEVYLSGEPSGISQDSWDSLRRNKVFLKSPITTPQGGGYKSLNVTIRKSMGLYANVRPVKAMHPFVKTNFPEMDVVVIRENEEDLYAGIEHQQTPDVVQTLKLISRPGSEKIIRYAFEYARAYGRKKVTCMTKDNIMKHADGLFHKVFDEVKAEYPDIEAEHYIIDIGTARLANRPERFDVVVTLNLYGDILSDITAEISGSVGMGGSANVGESLAMFEAIHGSAPDIAGQKIANPSGLLNGACMMLVHLGLGVYADKIQNALYKTIEDGVHTGDLKSEYTKQVVNTMEFADAVIARLGQKAEQIKLSKPSSQEINVKITEQPEQTKKLVGADLFVDWGENDRDANVIGQRIDSLDLGQLRLKMITNRGVLVYPNGFKETYCTRHWRCRLVAKDAPSYEEGEFQLSYKDINHAIEQFCENGLEVIKTENLYLFDGVRSFSLGQGESK